tara:strand:+ start:145 stop:1254 length:1110 start_codon:yes stop_codon:yes gene_type:complete
MSSSGLKTGDFSNLDVTYGLGVGTRRDNGTKGKVLTSGGTNKPMTWDDAGITEVLPDDGILVTQSVSERTIKAHIDGTTIVFANGSPTKLMKVANPFGGEALTSGTGITYNSGTTYDGSVARTISIDLQDLTAGTGVSYNSGTTYDGTTAKTLSIDLEDLTAGTGITFSTGTTYDGKTPITISTSATGGATYVSYPHTNTFSIPYISTNPHTASSSTLLGLDLVGRYLAETIPITATATSYKIELSIPLSHDQSTIKGSSFYRLDKDTTGKNPYNVSNNQSGINILVRNNNAGASAPDNRYFGVITSEIIITGLTIGTAYAFCPAFCYNPTSGTSSSASIQTGSGMGQFVITATPFSNGTIASAPSSGA